MLLETQIEIKSGQTVTRDYFTGLNRWLNLAGKAAGDLTLIYGGVESYQVKLLGWNCISLIGDGL